MRTRRAILPAATAEFGAHGCDGARVVRIAKAAGVSRRLITYSLDDEQDAFELELARQALASGLPQPTICRGLQVVNQVVNTALGGTLHQDMGGPDREHRHVRHPVSITPGSGIARVTGTDRDRTEASCYHQWHPEDAAHEDPTQQRLFEPLLAASGGR